MQIQAGLKDPFAQVAWPCLDYIVKGIKKVEAERKHKLDQATNHPVNSPKTAGSLVHFIEMLCI